MKDRYFPGEFDHVKLMSSSGGLGHPDSNLRMSYYGVGGIPDLIWQGTKRLVGAGTDVIDGAPYDAIVQNYLPDATPVVLEISDYNWGVGAHVTVDIALEGDLEPGDHTLRVYVIEDNLSYGSTPYHDILRDLLDETVISISADGETQQIDLPITMGAWNTANLRLLAFLQRESDREILQSCNTMPVADYAFRYYNLGERIVLADGEHTFGEYALFNTGTSEDTYELTIDRSELPDGWTAQILDDGTLHDAVAVTLAPGEHVFYNFVITPGSAGGGKAFLNMHSLNNRTDDRLLSYTVITTDTEILLVDDDGAETFESDYYAPALAAGIRSFAIWDRGAGAPSAEVLANFDAVVWYTGFAFPTLDAGDRAALGTYLDGGGALMVSGQDIGWELNDTGGAAYAWYQDYLHANYVVDDTNDYTLDGIAGDPISDGMSLTIQGGDGANNQDYPEGIAVHDAAADIIFEYSTIRDGALRADTGVYRVVYLGFGFEAIDNAADRELLMSRCIDWLIPDLTGVEEQPSVALGLRQNVPNPFNPTTEISFSLAEAGEVRLAVYDSQGRLVKVLTDGHRPAGLQQVSWNGRDGKGVTMSSGVYFYSLDAAGDTRTRKMLLLK